MANCYLILGSNSGDKDKILISAIDYIEKQVGNIVTSSSLYQTEPWGYQTDNDFLNQALIVETRLTPLELLHATQNIEKTLGRTIKSINGHYSDRPIDIDILFYDKQIINSKELTVPHPLICERRFVLIPLNEIASDLLHPKLKKTINKLLEECPDNLPVKRLQELN